MLRLQDDDLHRSNEAKIGILNWQPISNTDHCTSFTSQRAGPTEDFCSINVFFNSLLGHRGEALKCP